jgi:hypothetical protein
MSDYDTTDPGAVASGWSAPTPSPTPTSTPAADEYGPAPAAPATASGGLPPGVPGLPTGSTGQPATAPVGPRADPQPIPDFTPPPLQAPIPGAPSSPYVQLAKDLATGAAQVGDYKGGVAPKGSTDGSRDLGQTAGQQQHNADQAAAAQPTPNSPYSGQY